MDRRPRLHRLGILLPDVVRPAVTGRLQDMHRPRLPGVALARAPRLVEAADRQHRVAAAPGRARASASTCRCTPVMPMPEIRLSMPGKYSATIARLSPTASKFSPPR